MIRRRDSIRQISHDEKCIVPWYNRRAFSVSRPLFWKMSCKEFRPIGFPIYAIIDELITRLALSEACEKAVKGMIWFNKNMATWFNEFIQSR